VEWTEGQINVIFVNSTSIQPGLPPIQPPPFNILDKSTNITHSFFNILQEEGKEGDAMVFQGKQY